MKTHHLLQLLLPVLTLASVSADTIEMKDGTKYEGTVVKKDGDDYIVEVQVTKSIKDERRIPKASVARIVAEDKSETGFAEIAALVPVPDLTPAAEYEARVAKAEAFLKGYKESKHKVELQKIVDTLGNESNVISAGGVKFGGKLLTADQRKPTAYTLDSQIAFANVKRLAAAGNTVGALRAWSSFEKDFLGSEAYRDGVPFAISLMQGQLAVVTEMAKNAESMVKQREEGLKGMSDQQRSRSRTAIEEEMDDYKKIADAEKAAQSGGGGSTKWLTLNPYVKAPLEDTKRTLTSEIQRLQGLSATSLPKGDDAYTQAWEGLHKEGVTKQQVTAALAAARNAYLPKPYIDLLVESSPIPVDK